MNTVAMSIGALALAGASFGAGRISANAAAKATATAVPTEVACNSNDTLADMIKRERARHDTAVMREVKESESPTTVTSTNANPVH